MIQRVLINLHPNEYSQGLPYYPLAVNKWIKNINIKIYNLNVNVILMVKM